LQIFNKEPPRGGSFLFSICAFGSLFSYKPP
jgi:hypothetical protein